MPLKIPETRARFTRTIQDLNDLANSEFVRGKKFEDFRIADLKQLKSEDFKYLYKKKVEDFVDLWLKTREKLPNEEVTRFEQSEVKNLTRALENFHEQCEKDGLSVRELEEVSVDFLTDKYKRFFFNSKVARRIYKMNNAIASTSLGYWGFRSLGVLGSTNRFLLQSELRKSFFPIAYFTGVTCRFWAYITAPLPPVSKFFDGVSHIAMSPLWVTEYLINKVTGPLFRATPLRTAIPLNVTGEVAAGSGLTWDKLNHTYNFVQKMTQNWKS